MTILTKLWLQLLHIGFYLLYHQLAPTYDVVSWIVSFGKWREWQSAVLPYIKGRDVLELGHGPGHMLLTLRRLGFEVTGLDLSPQMGRLAHNRIRAAGVEAALVRAPAQDLPFSPASFDTVVATFPTDYIAEEKSLTELHRVLRENGHLVILPQARLTGGSLPVRLLEGLYRITGQRIIPDSAEGQVADPLLTTMHQRFQETGFDVVLEQVTQPGSKVTILIATRQDSQV